MSVDEETLMAFADGELSGPARAEVEAQLAEDEGLRAKLAAHQCLRARVAAAFDGTLLEPAPARLLAARDTPVAGVVSLAERRALKWAAREWGAMAASVAAGVLIGVGVMNTSAPLIAPTAQGLIARGVLDRALDTQLAADETGAVRIGLSFREQDGGFCRTFELTQAGTSGLACRKGEDWDVAMTAHGGQGGEVRMAGASEEIMAAVERRIAGEPLDADAEARARADGWR